MPAVVTLEQLRDYAHSNPKVEYVLDSCGCCLAAQMIGRVMWDSYRFMLPGGGGPDDEATVPVEFAEFTSRVGQHVLRGEDIAAALDRIIAGQHPHQAADDLTER